MVATSTVVGVQAGSAFGRMMSGLGSGRRPEAWRTECASFVGRRAAEAVAAAAVAAVAAVVGIHIVLAHIVLSDCYNYIPARSRLGTASCTIRRLTCYTVSIVYSSCPFSPPTSRSKSEWSGGRACAHAIASNRGRTCLRPPATLLSSNPNFLRPRKSCTIYRDTSPWRPNRIE